ncbi:hypothetical protein BJD58_gp39 [Gordonia phage UmaThurman]|uniref:hypothetical protein n=1 Tax=Gordonia phage UmaThurman TaxID=1821563 RepID=UPI00078BB5AC|nr:hypothetical protein BJD58_gp39 [Gordonia phage UmaThurman]AMS03939.1 hypothetical protein SEA_UMATHURMAN_39 [Gordonia phage UmaThurman]
MADAVMQISKIAAETIHVPIIGTSPLIMHRWSDKAKRQMLDAQQGKKNVKTVRDPQADYESSMYRIATEDGPDKYGFPVLGFKAATIGGARFYDKSVTMTSLRQFMFFKGVVTKADPQQLVEIHGEPRMREDVVRVGQGTDLRYRAEFVEWSAVLTITYVTSSLSRDSVLSLIDAGGMGVGVGEWRPQKSGEFGTFAIDLSKTIEVD